MASPPKSVTLPLLGLAVAGVAAVFWHHRGESRVKSGEAPSGATTTSGEAAVTAGRALGIAASTAPAVPASSQPAPAASQDVDRQAIAEGRWEAVSAQMASNTQAGSEDLNHDLLRQNLPLLVEAVGQEQAESFLASRARAFERVRRAEAEDRTWGILLESMPEGKDAAEAHFKRAAYLRRVGGSPDEVSAHLRNATVVGQGSIWAAESCCVLARGYQAAGNVPDAIRCYEDIVTSPAHWTPYKMQQAFVELAGLYESQGDHAASAATLGRMNERFPSSAKACQVNPVLQRPTTTRAGASQQP